MPSWSERLAERFKASGAKDIEQPIPEGAVRLPDLTIGGKTPQQLEKALDSGRVRLSKDKWCRFIVSDGARELLRSKDFTTLPHRQTISLASVNLEQLNFLTTDRPTTDEVYARANELGLDLCPAEVGPHLRLAYTRSEWLRIGMKPIKKSNGGSSVLSYVFFLNTGTNDTDWSKFGRVELDDDFILPNYQWNPLIGYRFRQQFVFSLRK
jgi:hypothetical protein